LNFGEEFQLSKVSDNWYITIEGEGGNCFINSKFITDEDNFVRIAEQLEKKNGTTLYSLSNITKK
jgi:hypothetical protein